VGQLPLDLADLRVLLRVLLVKRVVLLPLVVQPRVQVVELLLDELQLLVFQLRRLLLLPNLHVFFKKLLSFSISCA
jgi:hypothetical protein